MVSPAAVQRRMTGQGDSRGPSGILSRGTNVYNGGSPAAHSGGGPQFGRPPTPPGLGGNMPPGLGGPIPGAPPGDGGPMGGAPGPGMAPVESPMAPIVANMQQLESPMPSPAGEFDNPVLAALKQGGPPGMGGVGGNPSNVSPEIMAAIVRKLGAGGGSL